MADKKISELVNLTSLATDDEFVVVDADANATKRTTYGNLSSVIRGDIVDADMPDGSIVQVVHSTTTTQIINSTTSFIDTGLTATITPTSASNKILVIFSQSLLAIRSADFQGGALRFFRDATEIWAADEQFLGAIYYVPDSGVNFGLAAFVSASVLDAPATTSSTTYKMQGRPREISSSGSLRFQWGDEQASTLTLIEVVA